MTPNEELQKAFERKKGFSELMYIYLAEVAFITIVLVILFG